MPARSQSRSHNSSNGTPLIGTRHLGLVSVIGRRRVPNPAARMMAFMRARINLSSAAGTAQGAHSSKVAFRHGSGDWQILARAPLLEVRSRPKMQIFRAVASPRGPPGNVEIQ